MKGVWKFDGAGCESAAQLGLEGKRTVATSEEEAQTHFARYVRKARGLKTNAFVPRIKVTRICPAAEPKPKATPQQVAQRMMSTTPQLSLPFQRKR